MTILSHETSPEMIWIIDDEREIALQYSEALTKHFVSVVFSNPKKLIDVYKRHKVEPFALLSDLNMPEINGLDMVQQLREAGFAAHTILISGAADRNHLTEAINLHVDGFLEKPVRREIIQNRLLELLANKKEKQSEKELNNLHEEYRRVSYELLSQTFDYYAEIDDHFFEIIHHIPDEDKKKNIIQKQLNNLKITNELEKRLEQVRQLIQDKKLEQKNIITD